MKNFLRKLAEFFEDGDGLLSNTRLNATFLIWAGVVIGAAAIFEGKFDITIMTYSFGLIGAGTGTKLIQNSQENTTDNTKK